MSDVTTLTRETGGKWKVTTAESSYDINLDNLSFIRDPGPKARVAEQIRDTITDLYCVVGEYMLVTSGDRWVRSTPVVSIEKVES